MNFQFDPGSTTPCVNRHKLSGPQWWSLNEGGVPLYIRDPRWRVLHKAVACNRYLSRFTDSPTTRHLCGEEECVFHIYMEYERLQPLFDYLKGLLLKFWLHFSPTLLIFGHPVQRGEGEAGPGQDGHSLFRPHRGRRPVPFPNLWARVSLEREDAVFTGTLDASCGRWSLVAARGRVYYC